RRDEQRRQQQTRHLHDQNLACRELHAIVPVAMGAGKPFGDNDAMPSASHASPVHSSVDVTSTPLSAVETDLLVVPWFEGEPASAVEGIDAAVSGEIARALASREFQAKPYDLLFTPITDPGWKASRVAVAGGGRRETADGDLIRKLASTAGHAARQKRVERVAFAVRGSGDVVELAQAAIEGLTLAEVYGGSYKTADPAPPAPPGRADAP